MPKPRCLIPALIKEYAIHLHEQERAPATIQKYTSDLTALMRWLDERPLEKSLLLLWKEEISESCKASSVNGKIAVLNGFLGYMGWQELRLRPLKLQRNLFADESRELTRAEYARLVHAAQKKENERLSLVIQTICATGIRVSELRLCVF